MKVGKVSMRAEEASDVIAGYKIGVGFHSFFNSKEYNPPLAKKNFGIIVSLS